MNKQNNLLLTKNKYKIKIYNKIHKINNKLLNIFKIR